MKRKQERTSVQFIVPRMEGKGVATVAIVKARVIPPLTDEDVFLKTLKATLSEWFKTPAGKAAWDRSSDFNVGDLHCEIETQNHLNYLLRKHGIVNLKIAVFDVDMTAGNWTFDEVLREEEEET